MSELEFYVPEPEETPKTPPPAVEGDAAQLEAALRPPPQLEVELPQRPEQNRSEIRMAARALDDPDDPSVLLQQQLGMMPGMTGQRAADMAERADIALNNLGVTAKRMANLEKRKERRAKRGNR